MRSRPATPSQKFFRRTSQSPWEPPKPQIANSAEQIPAGLIGLPTTVISSRTYALHNNAKNSPTYLSYMQNQFGPNYASEKRIGNSLAVAETNQPQKSYASPKMAKQREQMKFTYIPIDTVGNKESIPTIRKKGIQSLDSGSQTKRSEEQIINLKDAIKLKEQHQKLIQQHKNKVSENYKLIAELNIANINISKLQNQLKQTKAQLADTEIQLKNLKYSHENTKSYLQTTQILRQKEKEKTKQAYEKLKKMEDQLKLQKYENSELMKIIEFKEKQILSYKTEMPTSPKGSKILVGNDRQNISNQMRAMQARSISTYQNNTLAKPKQCKQFIKDNKCNRFIQTENSNLQAVLKQNQLLSVNLANSNKLVNNMKLEIQQLHYKIKGVQQLVFRVQQSQKLIDQLNAQIIESEMKKLATKFKYH